MTPEVAGRGLECLPQELLPLSLGTRHMLQLAFDLSKLARELGESPREVLGRQHLLIVIVRRNAGPPRERVLSVAFLRL